MSSKKIDYNLLGQGNIKVYMYKEPKEVYDFLSYYQFDNKLNELNQLGAMRHVLKGAHYTRYEYMLLQMLLINRIGRGKKSVGLSDEFRFEELNLKGNYLSKAALLQCLAILTNIGHFPDTYTASKVWLHLLSKNKHKIRTIYRRGLTPEARLELEKVIQTFDYYKIHLLNTIYMLGRFKRKDKALATFSKKLLLYYIQDDNDELKQLFKIYHSIRRISYLLLDSNYVSTPFKVELSEILQTIENLNDPDELINEDSVFYKTLKYIDMLLEDALYLSPEIMLNKYIQSEILRNNFNSSRNKDFRRKKEIVKLLRTQNKENEEAKIFDPSRQQFLEEKLDHRILSLNYYLDEDKSEPVKIIEEEDEINSEIARRNGIFTMELSPRKSELRIASSLLESCNIKVQKSLQLAGLIIKLDRQLRDKGIIKNKENKKLFELKTLKFILEHCFSNFRVDFYYDIFEKPPFFFARGSQTVANQIEVFLDTHKDKLNSSTLHEIKTLIKKLEKIEYTGYVLAFAGSTKLKGKKDSEYKAEYDGIICMPNRIDSNFMYVIEAKGGRRGRAAAFNQLNDSLGQTLDSNITYKVESFRRRDAFANLSLKK